MISLLWTTTSHPLSVFIRWVFREDVSHFAILMDNRVVFQSNLYGMNLCWYSKFLSDSLVVTRMDLPLNLEEQEALYLRVTDKFQHNSNYDYGAFLYFGLCGIRHRLFGTPFPSKNAWGGTGFLCTEVGEVLKGFVAVPENLDMVSAGMLRKAVLDGFIS